MQLNKKKTRNNIISINLTNKEVSLKTLSCIIDLMMEKEIL
jgi:hypothetical protein